MKNFLSPILSTGAIFSLLAFQPTLHAMYARYTPIDLVASSELIVEGTYMGTEVSPDGSAYRGIIEIQNIRKGEATGQKVYIRAKGPDVPKHSEDISYIPGQSGLWLLKSDNIPESGLYLANHPQRFVPSSDKSTTESLLKIIAEQK